MPRKQQRELTGEEREHRLRTSACGFFALNPNFYHGQGIEDLRIAIDQGLPIVVFSQVRPGQRLPLPQEYIDYPGPKLEITDPVLASNGKYWERIVEFLKSNDINPDVGLDLIDGGYSSRR